MSILRDSNTPVTAPLASSQSTFSPSTPSSSPPYSIFVDHIIKSSDQQASIFLQQKLKAAGAEERSKIVDAICRRGFEMMAH
ncbi:hypothetical protein H0H92_001765, partial [Tricholoma furcatifolium]